MDKIPPTSASLSPAPFNIDDWFQQDHTPVPSMPVADLSVTGLIASDELLYNDDVLSASIPRPLTLVALELDNQLHPNNTSTMQPPIVAEAESFQLPSLSEISGYIDEAIPIQTETTADLNTPRLEDISLTTIYPHKVSSSSVSTSGLVPTPTNPVDSTPFDMAPAVWGVTQNSRKTPIGNLHQCDACERTFSRENGLQRHKLTHSNKKLHKCETCNRSFKRKTHLKTHQLTHTGEKPYQCITCGKSFSQSSNLKTHQRTHTGEKPFQCSQCGSRFSQRGTLTNHLGILQQDKSSQLKCSGLR